MGNEATAAIKPTGSDALRRKLIIPFPLHISQVRGARGQDHRDPIVAQQRGHIPIPIDEVPEARDQIPTLTPKMTTASDSLILSNILATIAREEVRYVGIVATDVLDTLFLTGMIREHYPDVQIVLLGADLRYTDPDFSLDFRGTILGSSYPLDPIHQRWTYPFHGKQDRRLFLTDLDMGTYNATLVLLNAEQSPWSQGDLSSPRLAANPCSPTASRSTSSGGSRAEAGHVDQPGGPAQSLAVAGNPSGST